MKEDSPQPEIRFLTVKELAEDAFVKAERFAAMKAMNQPLDYEQRRRAFVELAEAASAAQSAEHRLNSAIKNSR